MTSTPPPRGPDVPQIFDRRLNARRRRRASADYGRYSFLKKRVAEDFIDRLEAINRPFERILDIGAQDGTVGRLLAASGRAGDVFSCDLAGVFCRSPLGVCADEEALPFADASFDLALSAMSLHWVNDLPGALVQIQRALKPDGLMIAALPGAGTLSELRQSLLSAETELRGGAVMRVSPFLDVIDGAQLLQRAGFAMPVADADTVTVRYDSMLNLLADLRGMGETAAFSDRSGPALTRSILLRAAEIYAERFSDPDGRVRATFEIVTLSGWAPGAGQPVAKRPGSASVRLADALGVKERSAGEKPGE